MLEGNAELLGRSLGATDVRTSTGCCTGRLKVSAYHYKLQGEKKGSKQEFICNVFNVLT